MSSEELRLARIGQISVTARDVERATEFYRDRLGMKHLFSVSGMAFLDCGGIRLMLARPEKPEFDHPGSVLYFPVDDIRNAHEVLASRGVAFEDAPHRIARMETYDLWMAFFRDSEGNLLALMSEVARPQP
jgi:methylmalonyl-CoA/ethylmalonyl-CoA epimerase